MFCLWWIHKHTSLYASSNGHCTTLEGKACAVTGDSDYAIHKHSALCNTCLQLVCTLHWQSPSPRLQFHYNFGEFSKLSLWPTFVFSSVTFTFKTVIFSCIHSNKCHFHVIFSLACVTSTFFKILQVSFSLFSYFRKCHILAWEMLRIVK